MLTVYLLDLIDITARSVLCALSFFMRLDFYVSALVLAAVIFTCIFAKDTVVGTSPSSTPQNARIISLSDRK